MKNFLMRLARIMHSEKNVVVIKKIMLISGFIMVGSIGNIVLPAYMDEENLPVFKGFMFLSILLFIISGLLLRLDTKYYKPYVIIKGTAYIPTITRHWPGGFLDSFKSKCATCEWKLNCKACSDIIEDCDYYQKIEKV